MNNIFFAYESGHPENKDAISRGIEAYNNYQKSYNAFSWEDLVVGGHLVNATILKAIDDCDIFACDLTYQNHNVLFELGYAIGKRKKLLVLLNPSISGGKENYSSFRILKNIGYEEFQNGKDVLRILQKRKHVEETSVRIIVNLSQPERDSHDLLFLSSQIENQAALDIGHYIFELDARIIHNNSSEVDYQTLVWYVKNIVKCKNILIHLLGQDKSNGDSHNAEYSLFAGLGCGMDKAVMLLAQTPFRAPIDYSDILIEYNNAQDCVTKTSIWLKSRLFSQPISELPLTENEITEKKKLNLLKLGIGYETAEEEADNLLDYFIEIDTYQRALKRSSWIITGRKGAGKTALFIKLREYFKDERERSFNIILKPESDELLDNVELTEFYNNLRSKRALLTTVWRFVFFSRVFEEVYKRVSEQLPATIDPDSIEDKILKIFQRHENMFSSGHFTAMSILYHESAGNQEVLDKIYKQLLGPIIDVIRIYFKKHKFLEINLLADNLDKTWDANSDLTIQAEMILSLLEFNGKIPQELDYPSVKAHTILILRTDIFEYVLNRAREPDKLEIRRLELDWNLYPDRLCELIEARFRFILKIPENKPVAQVWHDYFAINKNKAPFNVIKEIVMARPRDIIYFVSKLFESAINNNRSLVEKEDLGYATTAYSNFLHRNMISETKAQFPEVVNIFSEVRAKYYRGQLLYSEFTQLLRSYNFGDARIEEFIKFLMEKNYLIALFRKRSRIITSFKELQNILKERRLFFFKYKVLLLLQPQRYRLQQYHIRIV